MPTAPERTSPCPPQRLSPPGVETVITSFVGGEVLFVEDGVWGGKLGLDEELVAMVSDGPFCRIVTPFSDSESADARFCGGIEGSSF